MSSNTPPPPSEPTATPTLPPPRSVPAPETVAARARAQLLPQRPARVPFFANAAQPEIGELRARQPLSLLSALTDGGLSPREPEGPLLSLSAH